MLDIVVNINKEVGSRICGDWVFSFKVRDRGQYYKS